MKSLTSVSFMPSPIFRVLNWYSKIAVGLLSYHTCLLVTSSRSGFLVENSGFVAHFFSLLQCNFVASTRVCSLCMFSTSFLYNLGSYSVTSPCFDFMVVARSCQRNLFYPCFVYIAIYLFCARTRSLQMQRYFSFFPLKCSAYHCGSRHSRPTHFKVHVCTQPVWP